VQIELNIEVTCVSRRAVTGKGIYEISTRSVMFTRITSAFVDVCIASSTCTEKRRIRISCYSRPTFGFKSFQLIFITTYF